MSTVALILVAFFLGLFACKLFNGKKEPDEHDIIREAILKSQMRSSSNKALEELVNEHNETVMKNINELKKNSQSKLSTIGQNDSLINKEIEYDEAVFI